MLRRFQKAPTIWWAWACIAILVSGALTLIVDGVVWSFPVGYGLATLYPALLVGGALRYAGRDVPCEFENTHT